MFLEDEPSIKAAIATMNPVARGATHSMVQKILQERNLIHDLPEAQRQTVYCCLEALTAVGFELERDRDRFERFIEDHSQNIWFLSVSIVLFMERQAQSRQMWGNVGKAAALFGAAALGAFFG